MRKSLKSALDALSTPLSSIFGSGFLIVIPILAGVVGAWSVAAMAGVCVLAYAVGGVIRYNIVHVEPLLQEGVGRPTRLLERGSDVALALAYVVSVSLYLHIFSSFVLGGLGLDTELYENAMTTGVILFITAIGITKGLKSLERMEEWALYLTILVIVAVVVAFARYDVAALKASGLILPKGIGLSAWRILTVVGGTLIVVQGFETSRYLGDVYDARTRVWSSRLAQIISTAVYIGLVALALPAVHTLDGAYGDNSLIQLVSVVAALLVIPLIVAAALSQFAAAVADTLAAVGSLEETMCRRLRVRWGYLLVGAGAIGLTWLATTYQIIAIASRAFAAYYLLQCLVAITVTQSWRRRVSLTVLAGILAFIVIFAVPAG